VRLGGNAGGTRVYSPKAKRRVEYGARRGGQVSNAKRKLKFGVGGAFLSASKPVGARIAAVEVPA
jgi:hypothetical protein